MLYFSLGLIGIFILSSWANQALAKALPFNLRLILLFPGVVLHELSHAIVCYFSGTPVKEIKLFSPTGGYVAHEAPSSRIIQFFISTAPLFVGMLVIFLALRALQPSLNLAQLNFSSEWLAHFQEKTGPTLLAILSRPKNWFYLWIIASTMLTFTPSARDIQLALTGLITLLILAGIFSYNHWDFQFISPLTNLILLLGGGLLLLTALAYCIILIGKLTSSLKIK